MIFQYTWQQVLDGTKTQTARIVKAGQYAKASNDRIYDTVYSANHRLLYAVGKAYAVQAGRGKPTLDKFILDHIRDMDVRTYTIDDIRREGFESYIQFIQLWMKMHDPTSFKWLNSLYPEQAMWDSTENHWRAGRQDIRLRMINAQPLARYRAWVLNW